MACKPTLFRRPESAVALAAALGLVWGCASKRSVTMEQIGPAKMTAPDIQSEVMGFADTFGDTMAQVADEIEDQSDPDVRLAVHHWKVSTISGAYAIAIEANPVLALLDMTVMVTLTRDSLEQHLGRNVFGDDEEVLLDAARTTESEIWTLASRVLQPEHVDQLHELIEIWRENHPDQFYVSYVRFADFPRASFTSTATTGGNILTLLQLDPLVGLDPALREFQQSRMLGERVLFYASRAPKLLNWQAQQLVYQTAATPEARQMMVDSQRLIDVSEQFATVAEQLPGQITAEREAAIAQIQEVISQERTGLLAEIDAAQGNLRGTLVELRQTIDAGIELSVSLDSTLKTVDVLASRLESENPDSKPLDIAEVRQAMTEASVTVRELNDLVKSLDQLLVSPDASRRFTDLEKLVAATELSGSRLANRIFILLALLVVIIFVSSVLRAYIGPRAATRSKREER